MSPNVLGALCVAAAFLVGALVYLWSEGGRLIEAAEAELDDDSMDRVDDAQVDPDIALVRSLARRLNNPDQLEAQIARFDFALWEIEA